MITENLAKIRATIPDGVTLVAVSKFHPAEMIAEAVRIFLLTQNQTKS